VERPHPLERPGNRDRLAFFITLAWWILNVTLATHCWGSVLLVTGERAASSAGTQSPLADVRTAELDYDVTPTPLLTCWREQHSSAADLSNPVEAQPLLRPRSNAYRSRRARKPIHPDPQPILSILSG